MSAEAVNRIMHPDLSGFCGHKGNKVLKIVKLADGIHGAIKDGITYHIQLNDENLVGKYFECLVSVDNRSGMWNAVPICETEVEGEIIDEHSDDSSMNLPDVEGESQDSIAFILSALSAIQQSLKDIREIVKSNADRISTLESRFDRLPDEIHREVSKQVEDNVFAIVTKLISDSSSNVQSQIKKDAGTTVLLGGDSISSTLFTSESYSVHYCPGDKTLHIREDTEGGYSPENRIITIPNLRKLTSIDAPRKVDAITTGSHIIIPLGAKKFQV